MNGLDGHPYVYYAVVPDGTGALAITCHCRFCNGSWRHRCVYPQKALVWVHQYATKHAHGAHGVRERFWYLYHTGLQQLRMSG